MMLVQEVGKDLLSNPKVCVVALDLPNCLWECQADRAEFQELRMLGGGGHDWCECDA